MISEFAVSAKSSDFEENAVRRLEHDGVVVITDLFEEQIVRQIALDSERVMSTPSSRGSFGYIAKDPFKRLYDGFLFSEHTASTVAHLSIISIIEAYLQDNILMTECLLKRDLGTNLTYFPYHRHTGTDLVAATNNRFGCGVIYYIHDTEEGAFCYVPGSHKLPLDKDITLLSESLECEELSREIRRVEGNEGSVVIFNEAGWHGPEQPVTTPRTVILSGYQSKQSSGNKTRTEMPILISNIRELNSSQRDAIGFSSDSRAKYADYHIRRRSESLLERIHRYCVIGEHQLSKWKKRLRTWE